MDTGARNARVHACSPRDSRVSCKLPIDLGELLRQRTVEGERIEYNKAGGNPDAILRTVCAFANDFANLGGGSVVIAKACDAEGRPVCPTVGLADSPRSTKQRFRLTPRSALARSLQQ